MVVQRHLSRVDDAGANYEAREQFQEEGWAGQQWAHFRMMKPSVQGKDAQGSVRSPGQGEKLGLGLKAMKCFTFLTQSSQKSFRLFQCFKAIQVTIMHQKKKKKSKEAIIKETIYT